MKKYLTIIVLAAILSVTSASLVNAAPGLQGGSNIHYVTFGESLYGIALQYGVSAEAILRHNGLANPDLIYVGQPLLIPGTYGNSEGYGQSPPGAYGCANFHIVAAGDTLSTIAYNYGVATQELLGYNNIYNSNVVYVGQKICLPPRAQQQRGYQPQPAGYGTLNVPVSAHYHTVTAGESLHYIAQQYDVSYLDIMRSNHLNNAEFIYVGQRLHIPGYQPAPPPVSKPIAPVHDYNDKPAYVPPAGGGPINDKHDDYGTESAPPPAPGYESAYDDSYDTPDSVPSAPDYQVSPPLPLLAVADHPIEVVVNGGENWVGFLWGDPRPDPNSITTLIVNTEEKDVNRIVRLRSGDYEVKGELGLIPEFGVDRFRFAFKYIPPGDYDVWLEDEETPSEKFQVRVEPGQRVEVGFRKGVSFSGPTFASPDGWVLASWDNPSVPHKNLGGWSNILIQTPASGLWIKIESEGGGYKANCFTGSKGPGACDFAGLSAGLYWIWIDGTDLTLKTYMDGNAYATFSFARQPVSGGEDVIGPVTYD